jgi:hypothetical protein
VAALRHAVLARRLHFLRDVACLLIFAVTAGAVITQLAERFGLARAVPIFVLALVAYLSRRRLSRWSVQKWRKSWGRRRVRAIAWLAGLALGVALVLILLLRSPLLWECAGTVLLGVAAGWTVMHVTAADWDVRADVLRDPRVIVGGSDAGAHVDMFVGATYTTSFLSDVVRDRSLVALEEAVRLITDRPARLYGLRDRGRVAEGWIADLTLFDPATVGNLPAITVADLPGGSSRLMAAAVGVPHVIVNGRFALRNGEVTGDRPGTTLRTGRDTERASAGASGSGNMERS